MKQDKELTNAIVDNLRLKSKILVGIFSLIFLGQIIVVIYLLAKTNYIGQIIPSKALVIGPLFLFTIISSELFFAKRLKVVTELGKEFPKWLPYFVVAIECSFPTTFILIASQFILGQDVITMQQLITSPPLIMYVIMIILSSLTLDLRISVFAGIVCGLEYCLVSYCLLIHAPNYSPLDMVNVVFRSMLIFLCGLIAGLISSKIRSAVQSSMESKNALIHKLDHLVAEKTKEVTLKNEILELKQQEIMDSMHYAKRIQDSLLPTEKNIDRNLNRLK